LKIIVISIFTFLSNHRMQDQLLPQERVLVIQEAMAGFIYEQVFKTDGEFQYDGHILDRSSKYSINVI
jgi:hypothetical protein